MNTLEIVFTKSKKRFAPGSLLIRWWTGQSYSHVARRIYLSFLDKAGFWHASEGRISWEYEEFFCKKNEIIKSIKIPSSQQEIREFNKACWEQVGGKYGFLQNIGIFYVDIMKMLGFKVNNPWKAGMNCSEALYRIILKPKFPELCYDPDTIKPHHIERILTEKFAK